MITRPTIAHLDLSALYNKYDLHEQLESFLIFGSYPEVMSVRGRQEKISLLDEFVYTYLLKNVLASAKIKKSEVLLNLVKLLAFQIGQLVSFNELATQLHIDVKTVARYLDLLEKSFVLCKLGGLSSNLRNEVTAKHKYYFLDLGVRNVVIAHFNRLDMRSDVGQLWENFIFIERLKKTTYQGFYGRRYFWRTYQGQEVDFVEEIEQQLSGFETKWSPTKKVTALSGWIEHYPQAAFNVITPENYLEFIT